MNSTSHLIFGPVDWPEVEVFCESLASGSGGVVCSTERVQQCGVLLTVGEREQTGFAAEGSAAVHYVHVRDIFDTNDMFTS